MAENHRAEPRVPADHEDVGAVDRRREVEALRVVTAHLAMRIQGGPEVRMRVVQVLAGAEQRERAHPFEVSEALGGIDGVGGQHLPQGGGPGALERVAPTGPCLDRGLDRVVLAGRGLRHRSLLRSPVGDAGSRPCNPESSEQNPRNLPATWTKVTPGARSAARTPSSPGAAPASGAGSRPRSRVKVRSSRSPPVASKSSNRARRRSVPTYPDAMCGSPSAT